ncbi:MAG: T9SS type A sorting domain-containing protein [Bacteroidetes bacterium]|nr:T9SS type A sorting domain-containing protein [Bacteroidota bacterium]
MKQILTCIVFLGVASYISAQTSKKPVQNPLKKNIAVKLPSKRTIGEPDHFLTVRPNPVVKSGLSINETTIGGTYFDLQSNHSTQNRIYMFPDGTISAVWTIGFDSISFSDRGTGINYYDGTNWGNPPVQRIETVRTGWPSIFALGPAGEGVVTHDNGSCGGLILNVRSQKGSGAWTETVIPGPTGVNGLVWPRAVSNGVDNNTIHVIALTRPTSVSGSVYQGLDGALLYNRSTDGGVTWDIANQILPGMTSAEFDYFDYDAYSLAEPKGDTLAFVTGGSLYDLFLMKSTDNGANWTKTNIFQFPYAHFDESHDLIQDTLYTCDGFLSVSLDNCGKANVFFGLMRVLNADTTDSLTTIFPYTDGLAYWNEDMPAYSSLNYDTLWNQGHLVGYLQDMNGNDTVMEFDSIGTYYCSLTSMPNSTIDAFGNIFVVFTSVMENLDDGVQNYRHIWGRMSNDGGASWGPFVDLNASIIHNYHECVFPSVSARTNLYIHIVYQFDDQPGMSSRWEADSYGDNTISYMKVTKTNFGTLDINNFPDVPNSVSQNYPNPFCNHSYIKIHINIACDVSMKITNMLGQEIFDKSYGFLSSGNHQIILDASTYRPGIYFYTVMIGNTTYSKKMIIN